ncbi:hypothetical protein TNCV_4650551 [Trichonephila clavipes]|nr:hypothetical protein TNCV_4650551 [Trichonephila clavipes]
MATLLDCPVHWLKYGNPKTGQAKKSGEKWTSFIFALDPAATRRVRPCSYRIYYKHRKGFVKGTSKGYVSQKSLKTAALDQRSPNGRSRVTSSLLNFL